MKDSEADTRKYLEQALERIVSRCNKKNFVYSMEQVIATLKSEPEVCTPAITQSLKQLLYTPTMWASENTAFKAKLTMTYTVMQRFQKNDKIIAVVKDYLCQNEESNFSLSVKYKVFNFLF